MRGFVEKEYQQRVLKLQKKMQKNDIDVVLITSPHNFRYFTGLDSYFWESPTRPWFLLIFQSNDPIAIIPSIGENALNKTWIRNIQTWPSPQPEDEGLSMLTKLIKDTILQKGNIGCELGQESHLRMSINDFDKLRSNFSHHNFVDASEIIWQLRIIKSSEEIKKMKDIISIASNVFDNFHNYIHKGMTEIEICNIFKKKLLDGGADHTLYMSCASGKGGYDQIILDPTERKLQEGDILVIDTGTTLDGYFCDFDRNYGFGNISSESQKAYDTLWKATEAGLDKVKPGVKCSDICFAMQTVLKKAGLTSNNVGRMGHGLGLQLTEPPSIMKNDNTTLQENMIITIEPCFEYGNKKMLVQEENILITRKGYELLTSRTPKKIPLIT